MRRLALVCLLLAACSGDDGGGPIAIDDLEPALVNAYCNLYVNCGLLEDQATCRSLDVDVDIDADLLAAVEAGKVKYDPQKARECLSGLGASCERGAATTSSEACDQTFTGTVAGGGQCAIDEECVSRQCDVPACPDACCQGTCTGDAPTPRPHAGESCATNSQCVDSYCDIDTTTCTAYKPIGEACTSTTQCGLAVCANQICTARPGPGEACTPGSASSCSLVGYTCSATSQTCVAYGLGGDPCTSNAECSPIYTCGAAGTCQLRPRLGEACDANNGCIDRSYCDEATLKCTAPKADGATCTSDRECQNDCDPNTGTCATEPICI